MRRLLQAWTIFVLCLGLLGSLALLTAQNRNLLTNPGFEAPFVDIGNEDQVADGWTAWTLGTDAERPLFLPASEEDTDRVREGTDAQKLSSYLSTHRAGVYQTVSGLTAGTTVTFGAYAYVWSASDDADRAVSNEPGGVTVQVGIDPSGGTDPESLTVVWSEPVEAYDAYTLHQVSAETTGEAVTVFVRSDVAEAVLLTDVFWDEASLIVGTPVVEETEEATLPDETLTVEVSPTTEEIVETATEMPTLEATLELPTAAATETPTLEEIVPTETPTFEPTPDDSPFTATAQALLDQTVTAVAVELTATTIIETATAVSVQTLTAAAIQETDIALAQTAAVTEIPPTATFTETIAASETPDLGGTATAVILQATATQAQLEFLTRVFEGELTATAAAATPIPTDVPPTSAPLVQTVVVVVTATTEPISDSPTPTFTLTSEAPTSVPATSTPAGTPIGEDLVDAFPGRIYHTVQRGEAVAVLAARYGSSTQAIIQANGLDENALIYIGQLLVIPVKVPPIDGMTAVPPVDTGQQGQGTPVIATAIPTPQPTLTGFEETYVVLPGDTLSSVATKYNTTVTAIAQLNGIVNINSLKVGQVLIVPGTAPAQPSAGQSGSSQTHVVQYGDTLAKIALRYGVTIQRLAEANNLANVHLIYAGQTLVIP